MWWLGDLLIAFARISRAQFVEAFEVVRMEDISGGSDDLPLEDEVDFVRCQQVAAAVGRDLFGVPTWLAVNDSASPDLSQTYLITQPRSFSSLTRLITNCSNKWCLVTTSYISYFLNARMTAPQISASSSALFLP